MNRLKPTKKVCRQCGNNFEILEEDIAMYKKLRVPPPTLCFDCRRQRRYGFYNNVLKFYKKECSASGEKVISTFSPESPYKIFNLKHWWSKKWGGEEYSKEYNLEEKFFEQFKEFSQKVPHPAILSYYQNLVDSSYTISSFDLKNCYFTSMAGWSENVHYSFWATRSKDSLGLLDSDSCENCYQLVGCEKCYGCQFCQECENCVDGVFLYDCRNCQNCFGCFNLRHKKYCFFNEQLNEEEYKEKVGKIDLGNRNVFEKYRDRFDKFIKGAIRENLDVDINNINSVGDKLYNAKDCYQAFITLTFGKRNENVRYATDFGENRDCMDLYIVGPNVSLGYELVEVFGGSNLKFSYFLENSLDSEYCLNCTNCKHCFGCVSLKNKEYSIFNKQYSKENYYSLLDKIKTKILQDGEYGEFFPLSQAVQEYNNTYAMVEFPLTKQEVLKKGWQWHDESKDQVDLKGLEALKKEDAPVNIKNVKDDILEKAIICEISDKPFRLIKPELEFYRKCNLPVPTVHPYERIMKRFKKRNPTKLWDYKCDKCGKAIETSYPPEKQKELKIYCHECYVKEIG